MGRWRQRNCLPKKYDEPESCGSAAHFLLGVKMEGYPPGHENVEGGELMTVSANLCSTINDSNKCQSSSPIDVTAGDNDVQVDINFVVDAQLDDDHHAAGDVFMKSNDTLIIIGITVPIINGVVNSHYNSIS